MLFFVYSHFRQIPLFRHNSSIAGPEDWILLLSNTTSAHSRHDGHSHIQILNIVKL